MALLAPVTPEQRYAHHRPHPHHDREFPSLEPATQSLGSNILISMRFHKTEREFRFDPSKGVDPQKVVAVDWDLSLIHI